MTGIQMKNEGRHFAKKMSIGEIMKEKKIFCVWILGLVRNNAEQIVVSRIIFKAIDNLNICLMLSELMI